jgi:hypothetical protein
MSQDEILAALREVVAANNQYTTWTVSTPHLVALVNLAIDREREACAKDCENINSIEDFYGERPELICAKAIRARNNP